MAHRKNIFRIGRKGHEGDENQLTEMLAYLFQEERLLVPMWLEALGIEAGGIEDWEVETQRSVPGGFVDLVLFVPGQTLVIVESKLGSTTDFDQISKYIAYLKSVAIHGTRALVFMTQHPEPWPAGVEVEAADEVALILRRWQALGDVLRHTESVLANDFVEMLEDEGLVTPDPLTATDWQTWRDGHLVSRRLGTLLQETGEALGTCAPGLKSILPVNFSNTGAILRGFDFDSLSMYVGFSPLPNPTDPDETALILAYVLNKNIPVAERRAAGRAAVERAASRDVSLSPWSEYHIVRTTPAPSVLTGADFNSQGSQLVEHVNQTLRFFQDLAYLDPNL